MSADNNPRGFAQETEASTAPECEPQHEVTPVPAVSTMPVVRVEPLGATFEAPPELTLLEAASFAGIRLPRLCRNGTCRTCLCRIVSGEIRYTIEWPGLSREEKAQGDVLTCVAVALTDLVLDVPDAELA